MSVNIFSNLPKENFEETYDPNTSFGGGLLPEGEYVGEVKFADSDTDPAEQWGEFGQNPTHYWTKLMATIAEGDRKGRRVYSLFNTQPRIRSGEKTISGLTLALRAVGERDKAVNANTPVELARATTEVFGANGGRKAKIAVEWNTGACRSCKERGVRWGKNTPTGVRGMTNFPYDEATQTYTPKTNCPTCGGELQAQTEFRIVGAA